MDQQRDYQRTSQKPNREGTGLQPGPLGRKYYLFAGSHTATQRAAMIYSFLGTCMMHGANPHQWLSHTLQHILSTKYNEIRYLYPQNFKFNTHI